MTDDRIPIPNSTLTRKRSSVEGFQQRARESSSLSKPKTDQRDQPSGQGREKRSRKPARPISPASPQQRAFVKDYGHCIACGAERSEYVALTFAHWWPRGRGGCNSPLCGHVLCVRPGGTGCHDKHERGELDLLRLIVADPFWDAQGRERFQHALIHAQPVQLLEHLAATRICWAGEAA
jgi:hypothetical protein